MGRAEILQNNTQVDFISISDPLNQVSESKIKPKSSSLFKPRPGLSLLMLEVGHSDRELLEWVGEFGGRKALRYVNKVRKGHISKSSAEKNTPFAQEVD